MCIFSERSPTSINPPRRLVANGRGSQQNRVNSFDTKKNCVEISPINLGEWRRVRFARPKLWNEFAYIVVSSSLCLSAYVCVCVYIYISAILWLNGGNERSRAPLRASGWRVSERRGEYTSLSFFFLFFSFFSIPCLHATFSTRLYW